MAEVKGWKRQRTTTQFDTEVSLSEFDTEQLLQALIDDGMITETEAVAIRDRNGVENHNKPSIVAADADLVDDAWTELLRGRKGEALHCIERALGNQWLGRLS